MHQMPTVKLDGPIQSATAVTNQGDEAALTQGRDVEQIQNQKARLNELLSDFENIVEILSAMQSELFRQHRDDIINLAVEISRKILAHRIEQEDYKIQDVIRQVLDDAPTQKDIVIRLNPKDYAQIEQLTKSSERDFAKGATFVADASISPAQCLLETPKGIVESFIDGHLDRISEALKKAG
jgi:flagellar biosynthesis/type III secretory pathway protein FliH